MHDDLSRARQERSTRVDFSRLGDTVWLARRGSAVLGYVGLDEQGYVAFDPDLTPLASSAREDEVRAVFTRAAPAPVAPRPVRPQELLAEVRETLAAFVRDHRGSGMTAELTFTDPDLGIDPAVALLRFADGGVVLLTREHRDAWEAVIEPPVGEIQADTAHLQGLARDLLAVADLSERLNRRP